MDFSLRWESVVYAKQLPHLKPKPASYIAEEHLLLLCCGQISLTSAPTPPNECTAHFKLHTCPSLDNPYMHLTQQQNSLSIPITHRRDQSMHHPSTTIQHTLIHTSTHMRRAIALSFVGRTLFRHTIYDDRIPRSAQAKPIKPAFRHPWCAYIFMHAIPKPNPNTHSHSVIESPVVAIANYTILRCPYRIQNLHIST